MKRPHTFRTANRQMTAMPICTEIGVLREFCQEHLLVFRIVNPTGPPQLAAPIIGIHFCRPSPGKLLKFRKVIH